MPSARGYNDKLLRSGQLEKWLHYLEDNTRRLLMKREHPDLFRVQRKVSVAGTTFSALGNRFLLNRPVKRQVQCSRRLSESEIQAKVNEFLAPWEHHNEALTIKRSQCLQLNDLARLICAKV